MSSSSGSSSRTLSPAPTKKAKKSHLKDKGSKKSAEQQSGYGKNEGVDPTWAYKPPENFRGLENTTDAGAFDWDMVEGDEDVELWLIRVPESVKPKYLENTSIELAAPSKSMRAGTINRKHATFDIWSVGDDDNQHVGGEEIKGLSCLLPRKSKKGKLFPTSKPFARHIVISAQAAQPSIEVASGDSVEPIVKHKNPPRQCYPKGILKHRFMPYGSVRALEGDVPAEQIVELMEVDEPEVPLTVLPSSKKPKEPLSPSPKKVKGKKRKGDGEVPTVKKSKKVKFL
ncbi:hypothetical protein BDZ94DRAFT_1190812 [Collybia nuda]|uniref:DNA-directed RNA polymerase I subunit RPA34 n=1 Tax=Collybia nuda TaxID=64659 RepID=A0A9P5Y9D5_9AGAR|nr:hypothetical protein BDZ94DRAFT_1190812 [Collybia nuda]